MRSIAISVTLLLSAQATLHAQVVMLPTFRNFSYSGSVLVPDGGTTHLGSVSRAASGSRSTGFGPFRSRGSGQERSVGSASARVQIIDLAEMDRQILGGTPEEFMRRNRAKRDAVSQGPRPVREATPTDPLEAAKKMVRDARKASKDGFLKAADYYYRTAISNLPDDLASIALLEYQRFLVLQRPAVNVRLAATPQ